MRLRWVVIPLLVLLAACAGAKVRTDLTYEGTYESYEKIFDNWTRSARLYKNFSTIAIFSATYFSLPMRRAYVSEYGRAYDMPMVEREAMLQREIDDAGRRIEMVLTFYTPRERFNDLSRPESSWRLWLIDANGVKVEAAKIEQIRVRHKKEYLLYPHYNEWSRLYRASFPAVGPDGKPLTTETGAVTLRVTGVEGMADLVWEIPPGTS